MGAEQDTIFSQTDIKKTAAAYGTKEIIFENMAHDMMLEKEWQKVADSIINNVKLDK